ncbi:hypothetical protein V5799_006991 [Amblyomma americanum]|uniref:Methyltransferase type 11 domain-containing protein n=1 Tax=Amblyomma americanum TaxID=6943 RepID=A0AAQ4DUT1_AMBAM
MSHFFKTGAHASIYAKFRPTAPQALVDEVLKFLAVKEKKKNSSDGYCCVTRDSATAVEVLLSFLHPRNHYPSSSRANHHPVTPYTPPAGSCSNRLLVTHSTHDIPSFLTRVSPAETISEKDESVQLVTVMQAVHWFDLDKFYKEVTRVLVPNGVLALCSYLIPKPVSKNQERMDSIIHNEIYKGLPDNYWNPVRDIVDNLYRDIRPAFEDHVRIDCIEGRRVGTVADYVNYTKTWSAYQLYLKKCPAEAEELTRKLTSILMEDAGKVGEDPEKTSLEVKTQFFMILARKPGP